MGEKVIKSMTLHSYQLKGFNENLPSLRHENQTNAYECFVFDDKLKKYMYILLCIYLMKATLDFFVLYPVLKSGKTPELANIV